MYKKDKTASILYKQSFPPLRHNDTVFQHYAVENSVEKVKNSSKIIMHM